MGIGVEMQQEMLNYDPLQKLMGDTVRYKMYWGAIMGDEVQMICGYPAPASISATLYDQALFPNTVAKVTQEGKSIDDAIKWAINELEGFMRG